jgi:hypothetical protein
MSTRSGAILTVLFVGYGCSSSSASPDGAAGETGGVGGGSPTPAGLTACAGPKGAAHFAIDPADQKCKPDGTTTNIGAPCVAANPTACGTFENATCLDEQLDFFPGGYCNVDPCTAAADHLCPIGSSCVELEGENGQCFKNCATDSDCRTAMGYFCLDMTPDDHPGGLWISGTSRKICSRTGLTCGISARDCPAVIPHCLYPNGGGDAYLPDGGMAPPPAGADGATILPVCVK